MQCRISVLVYAMLCFVFASPAVRADTATTYGLLPEARFESGCFGMCDCPISIMKLGGSFVLRFIGFDGLFDRYEVANVIWTIQRDNQLIPVTGSGTYRFGGEVALQQQLQLDLAFEGGAPEHFDSGLVVGDNGFPRIDIVISKHGMLGCTDSTMHVVAAPRTATDLELGTAGILSPRAAPNPFRERTEVLVRVGRDARVDLRLYDARGRCVRTLVANAAFGPGFHVVPWDGRNDAGVGCAAGVYMARLLVDGRTRETRLVKME